MEPHGQCLTTSYLKHHVWIIELDDDPDNDPVEHDRYDDREDWDVDYLSDETPDYSRDQLGDNWQ